MLREHHPASLSQQQLQAEGKLCSSGALWSPETASQAGRVTHLPSHRVQRGSPAHTAQMLSLPFAPLGPSLAIRGCCAATHRNPAGPIHMGTLSLGWPLATLHTPTRPRCPIYVPSQPAGLGGPGRWHEQLWLSVPASPAAAAAAADE